MTRFSEIPFKFGIQLLESKRRMCCILRVGILFTALGNMMREKDMYRNWHVLINFSCKEGQC